MEEPPARYRRLRKASDLSVLQPQISATFRKASDRTDAWPPCKRMRRDKTCTSYEDRISRLPDGILIMILDKLDTRTTMTTIILSKRWCNLPRCLTTCYDLAVNDMLPPRYHRLKRLNMEAKAGYEAEKNMEKLTCIYAIKARYEQWMSKIRPLTAILERYERRAMRRYVKQVNAFLQAPKDVCQRRPVQKLRLQTVGKIRDDLVDQWITAAIAKWGVEDFELVIDGDCLSYDLKQLDGYQNVRLKQLVLSNCHPVYAWNCLTMQRLTKLSLGEGSYMGLVNDILRNCVQLRDFRVTSSRYYRAAFPINVPTSKIRNLQVDRCSFGKIYLISLPCLETFYCHGSPTKLYYGDVPLLRQVSLDYSQTEDNGRDDESGIIRTYPLSKFFRRMPPLECLVLQFKGPQMWIEPLAVPGPFSHLKKLFIANVMVNWDALWILLLLDAAPALESFRVHFDKNSVVGSGIVVFPGLGVDEQQQHQYRRLKELLVAGFDGVGWQTGFVKMIMKKSPLLRRIHLLDGQVMDDGQELGGLQIIPRRREWHECERAEVLEDLTAGIRWPPEIILE
ncbi:hypothetical protein PR202_ga13843 [Eleusine coracana subsp. coracana]|uniref:F-box domain-containing protein n=1 Tax=Eleusine coracana subsp. coracana TaxID=191504 RepID=A0AAV5CFH5_ELECO|nr:hypothetical protein QOZ80_3AG0211990 [Eleusine coracana subsp. coracana]GJM96959.1 hypothetical protein PR202_ga13843 [Eleusine coracana subsp. coracana]